ncbi:MAG: rubrerythrin family protein [Thermoleophilia bacterium]
MADSMKNLAAAFAGESQANRSYLAFAAAAEAEGLTQVAKRFRVAAASETVHAINHLKTMGGVKDSAGNLAAAIGGENHEHTSMYPEFIEIAVKEGNEDARFAFFAANEAEKVHEKMFAEAAQKLADLPESSWYVCEVCGMTYENEAPDACVVCTAPKARIPEFLG